MHVKSLLNITTSSFLSALLLVVPATFAEYEELDAPFTLDFGMDAGQSSGAELLMTPSADPFSLQWDALEMGVGHASAMAVIANREPGARFSLQADVRPEWFVPGQPDGRIGFAVLGGPHDPPGNAFDTPDGEFYSLTWSPSTDGATSLIEIREGFQGALLGQEVWEGRHPNNDNSFEGIWEIYRFQGQGTYDAAGALTLTFTLTDQDGHSQDVSASIADPRDGNLFGFGGALSSDPLGDPRFGFLNFSVSGNIVLNERFVDGERLLQELPRTSAWYGTGGSAGADNPLSQPSEGIITLDASNNAQLLTHFTDAGPVALGVGETLKISFGFQMTGAGVSNSQAVRIGVMDSSGGGGRVEDDTTGTAPGSGLYNGYTGYGGFFDPAVGGETSIRKREPENNALLSSNAVWPRQETAAGTADVILDNTDYAGEFLILRAADGVDVTFTLTGPNFPDTSVAFTDTAGDRVSAFDTFAIWVNQGQMDSFSLTSVDIEILTPEAAPDGATFAAWQDEHFPGETDPAIVGPDANPAGDGIRNFLKYAFNLDPTVPSTAASFLQKEIVGGKLRLTYVERTDATDIEYVPQASADLAGWGEGPESVAEVGRDPVAGEDMESVTVEATLDGDPDSAFLRVEIREK